MTAVTETFRKVGVIGDLKIICIQTDENCDDNFTIDLHSDATDGKGTVMTQILNTLFQEDDGTDAVGTFDPATGIYTVGNVTTGIHNLTIIGY